MTGVDAIAEGQAPAAAAEEEKDRHRWRGTYEANNQNWHAPWAESKTDFADRAAESRGMMEDIAQGQPVAIMTGCWMCKGHFNNDFERHLCLNDQYLCPTCTLEIGDVDASTWDSSYGWNMAYDMSWECASATCGSLEDGGVAPKTSYQIVSRHMRARAEERQWRIAAGKRPDDPTAKADAFW